jgi:hypothetical protein
MKAKTSKKPRTATGAAKQPETSLENRLDQMLEKPVTGGVVKLWLEELEVLILTPARRLERIFEEAILAYLETGGEPDDWDRYLAQILGLRKKIGRVKKKKAKQILSSLRPVELPEDDDVPRLLRAIRAGLAKAEDVPSESREHLLHAVGLVHRSWLKKPGKARKAVKKGLSALKKSKKTKGGDE